MGHFGEILTPIRRPAEPDLVAAGSPRATVLTNARIVLPDRVMHGTLALNGTLIAEASPRPSGLANAIDCAGDLIIPGLVDLHTDNLERQVQPRSAARWPSRSAFVVHDAQCAAAGVTTVLDALCVGELGYDDGRSRTYRDGVADLAALAGTGLLKSDHFLHLRCELSAPDTLDQLALAIGDPRLRMVSLMDHVPGVGQFSDIAGFRALCRREGRTPAATERLIADLQARRGACREGNRKALLALLLDRGVPLASHDDRTAEEVEENFADGIRISEFPVHIDAARVARAYGMAVVAGAPNLVRGSSHSGNVAVSDLLRDGLLTALASDYVPASLAAAAFAACRIADLDLPEAVALVSERPARLCGLLDRGRIERGLRADLVRIRPHDGLPVVRAVWRAGERVA